MEPYTPRDPAHTWLGFSIKHILEVIQCPPGPTTIMLSPANYWVTRFSHPTVPMTYKITKLPNSYVLFIIIEFHNFISIGLVASL